jgi:hypothetical protein
VECCGDGCAGGRCWLAAIGWKRAGSRAASGEQDWASSKSLGSFSPALLKAAGDSEASLERQHAFSSLALRINDY